VAKTIVVKAYDYKFNALNDYKTRPQAAECHTKKKTPAVLDVTGNLR
jgi:hypothetical protein